MKASIDHLNRYVSNIEKFIEFYSVGLEYQVIGRGIKANGKPYAILKGHGHELFISEAEEFQGTDSNFRHIGYAIENVEETLEKLKRLNLAGPEQQIIYKKFSQQFYLRDPDGFEIDFIQWTDKSGFYESLDNGK